MRHRKKGKRLGRPKDQKRLLLKTLTYQLLKYGRIKTTVAKAKVLREVVEPLITRAKKGTLHDRREVLKVVNDKGIVKKLFDEIGPFFKDRNGGYTRIIKYKNRVGDNAEIAIIELINYKEIYKKEGQEDKKKEGKTGKKQKEDKK